jgi:hypothetical protein
MRKTTLFAVVAAVIVTGFGVWAASPTNARIPSMGQGIEPFQLMMNAKGLPTEPATPSCSVEHSVMLNQRPLGSLAERPLG